MSQWIAMRVPSNTVIGTTIEADDDYEALWVAFVMHGANVTVRDPLKDWTAALFAAAADKRADDAERETMHAMGLL